MAFGNRLIDIGGAGLEPTLGSLEGAVNQGSKNLPGHIFPNGLKGIHWSDDGTKFFMLMQRKLYFFNGSDSGILSIGDSYDAVVNITGDLNNYPIMMNSDGTIIQTTYRGSTTPRGLTYQLSTPYDVSTINSPVTSGYFPFLAGTQQSAAVGYSRDGSILATYRQVQEGVIKKVFTISLLNEPFNLSAGWTTLYSTNDFTADTVGTYGNKPVSIAFNNNGLIMLIMFENSGIRQYDLTTPYDINTATQTSFNLSLSVSASQVAYSADYTKVYFSSYYSSINQWNLV